MAPAPTASTARRPARPRLAMPGKKKTGPQPVGATGKPKPNRFLLGVLGVVALAAMGRLAMPGMFGGGGHAAPFTTPLLNRHLVPRVTATTAPGGSTGTTLGRPTRDPFTPPAGYGTS